MNIRVLIVSLSLACLVAGWILYRTIAIQTTQPKAKPYVVCTTTLIGNIITEIARDSIHLEVLMGPGVDPHTYKPIEKDLVKIAKADMIMYHGLHLEARMAELFEHLNSMKPTIAVTKNIPANILITANNQAQIYDPHVWFDPNLWIYVVTTVTESLCKLYSQETQTYQHNCEVYINQIKQMYQATHSQLTQIPKQRRILVTSHDAFSYFARAYDFQVVSLQGINTASQAGISDLKNIVQVILDNHIPTIFVESCTPARSMQAIQERVKAHKAHVAIGQELFTDSLGNPDSPEGTYLGMFNYNIDAIIQGLK